MNMCVFVSESKVSPGMYVLVSMSEVCMSVCVPTLFPFCLYNVLVFWCSFISNRCSRLSVFERVAPPRPYVQRFPAPISQC